MHTRLAVAVFLLGPFLSRGQAAPVPPTNVVPYGTIIKHCTVPGVVALTFDDGPYMYTNQILDLLDQHQAKATFFINGENYSNGIDDPRSPWPNLLRRMINSGHQVGSHTWSHIDLSYADSSTRQYQVQRLEQAFTNVIGKRPTYLRPPYASCSSDCLSEMEQLGYHVVNFDVDTKDYLYNRPGEIQAAMHNFATALGSQQAKGSILVLSHDVYRQTAEALVPFMLQKIREAGYRAVTVGECLADPVQNWYRSP